LREARQPSDAALTTDVQRVVVRMLELLEAGAAKTFGAALDLVVAENPGLLSEQEKELALVNAFRAVTCKRIPGCPDA